MRSSFFAMKGNDFASARGHLRTATRENFDNLRPYTGQAEDTTRALRCLWKVDTLVLGTLQCLVPSLR